MSAPPSAAVLDAFGVPGAAVRLEGGQGRSWRVGDVVLKPVDDPLLHAWISDVLAGWDDDADVRVPAPVPSRDGSWVYGGWSAARYLPGRAATVAGEPAYVRSAAEAFHRAVAHVPPPALLGRRTDRWAYGDRVAWEDAEPVGAPPTRDRIERLRSAYRPVRQPVQVVHGDLGGNLLRTPDGPAVIDWAPYARPAAFALAVVAVDAVLWDGVPPRFLDLWSDLADWYQLVARALVYRLATDGVAEVERAGEPVSGPTDAGTAERAVAWALFRDQS